MDTRRASSCCIVRGVPKRTTISRLPIIQCVCNAEPIHHQTALLVEELLRTPKVRPLHLVAERTFERLRVSKTAR
jgi:hypothetical protein